MTSTPTPPYFDPYGTDLWGKGRLEWVWIGSPDPDLISEPLERAYGPRRWQDLPLLSTLDRAAPDGVSPAVMLSCDGHGTGQRVRLNRWDAEAALGVVPGVIRDGVVTGDRLERIDVLEVMKPYGIVKRQSEDDTLAHVVDRWSLRCDHCGKATDRNPRGMEQAVRAALIMWELGGRGKTGSPFPRVSWTIPHAHALGW
ncbi:hypothetical protein [Brachybacterium sp.]|uniref:hypothetical protein n=1 Tax=Brachybacterium sp. TaxID=1891286 RepID=UPI003F982BEA